jgi:site-specific recombinase XerD
MAAPADLDMFHRSFVRSLRAQNRSPGTIEVYGLAIERFTAFLSEQPGGPSTTAEIGRRHVEDFLAALANQGLAGATLSQRYRSLHRFFAFLVDEGEIPAHPMEKMHPPFIPEHPVPVLIEDQIRALLDTAKGHDFLNVRDTPPSG